MDPEWRVRDLEAGLKVVEKLEERVDKLEGEVNKLENEVKEILLEIKNHLVEGYLPSTPRPPSGGAQGNANQAGLGAEEENTILGGGRREGLVDLDIITTVGGWMAGKVEKFGTQRMAELLELYERSGGLPVGVKEALVRLIHLDEQHEGSGMSPGDSATLLRELDKVLGEAQKGRPGRG